MTNKEFTAYVFEQRRQGMSDSQIARSLGMSLAHFIGKLNEIEKEQGCDILNASPVERWSMPKKDKKPVVKPVSGAEQPKEPVVEEPVKEEPAPEVVAPAKPAEDLSWME